MNLLFLYGPPAAGKLTVSTELARMTGYKLLDNHKVTDYISEVFVRSDSKYDAVRSMLGRKARINVYEAAAMSDLSLIATFTPIADGWKDFMRQARDAVERNGGKVCFVQLLPSKTVMLERTIQASRQKNKIATTERWLEVAHEHPHIFERFPHVEHLVINNSELSPNEAAQLIMDYYKISKQH